MLLNNDWDNKIKGNENIRYFETNGNENTMSQNIELKEKAT